MSNNKLTQTQQLSQRLLPQQLRLARMLEKNEEEIEEEINRELEENPALTRLDSPTPPARYYTHTSSSDSEGADPATYAIAHPPTLAEHLDSQLSELNLNERKRRITGYLTGAIDSNGYFTREIPEMTDDMAMDPQFSPPVDRKELLAAIATIQSLDPPGIGAFDLRDCIQLQLKRLPETADQQTALEIVKYYFDIYSRRNFRLLSEESHIPMDRLKTADSLIRTLNPKPAAAFTSESDTSPSQSASPDFIIETDGDSITISYPNSLPELAIEESFKLSDSAPATQANSFINTRAREARSFIELLINRRDTLMKIMRAIADIQRDFFVSGDDESRIRPMVLRDIAARTGFDISTISRATAGKWLATPFGIYSLKSFFNEQVGTDASSREVMARIRTLIDDEDPAAPLTDDTITETLNSEGYELARRTVAKYRDRLGLPSARLRRHR